jgi:hypothetical protein
MTKNQTETANRRDNAMVKRRKKEKSPSPEELSALLAQVLKDKEKAILAKDFNRAAELKEQECALNAALTALNYVLKSEELSHQRLVRNLVARIRSLQDQVIALENRLAAEQ